MTYGELLEQLESFSPEQLKRNVTIHYADMDEFLSIKCVGCAAQYERAEQNDLLDFDHAVLST